MKISKIIFFFFFDIFLFFPDSAREIGFGSAGSRILFFDIFILLIVILTFSHFYESIKELTKEISLLGLILFGLIVSLSLIRGLPAYGGLAIGEARWYLCSILILVGYIIYDSDIIKGIKLVFFLSSFILSIVILFRYIFNIPWNEQSEAIRFSSGRESLIICISCLFLIYDNFFLGKEKRVKKIFFLCFLILILLIGQTRTIFVLFPLMVILVTIFWEKFYLIKILKFTTLVSAVSIIVVLSIQIFIRPTIIQSTSTSVETLGEIFQSSTYKIITDPNLMATYSEDFSPSGNTLWRAYVWGQTFQEINSASMGWFVGLPMGSGYEFYSPNKELIVGLEPHNDYISIISKIGLVGLVGYILIIYSCIYGVFQLRKYVIANKEFAEPALVISTIIFCLLFFSFTNDEIRSYGIYFWIWIFLGFGFHYLKEVKEQYQGQYSETN